MYRLPNVRTPEHAVKLATFAVAAVLGLGALAPAQASSPTSQDASAVASMVSQYRAAHGLGPLRVDSQLNRAAAHQTAAMAQIGAVSHSAGGEFGERIRAHGIRGAAAENLGYGYVNAAHAVEGWKSSSGHNANLLHPAMGRMGFARVPGSDGRLYWTMILAR